MATRFSDTLTQLFAAQAREGKPAELGGTQRMIVARLASSPAAPAADVIIWGKLPANSIPTLGSAILVSATLGGTATLNMGSFTKSGEGPAAVFTVVTTAKYKAAATVTADVKTGIADTIALSCGVEEANEVWIGSTVAAATLAAAVVVTVLFAYVSGD